jgi:ubiquinone/menaquinone biosynthesis C-methylase UbiE
LAIIGEPGQQGRRHLNEVIGMTPKTGPFDRLAKEYDAWFDENHMVFMSELKAIEQLMPEHGTGLEVGAGTGRFAESLGIKYGLEPAKHMREMARSRGINVVDGLAECLPFTDSEFDFILMVTVVCFLDDVRKAFAEARRVLKEGGVFLVAFIDRDSPLGQLYNVHKDENEFYRHANFYSATEIHQLLNESGFKNLDFVQTVFHSPSEIREIEEPKPGHGRGGFVVVKSVK